MLMAGKAGRVCSLKPRESAQKNVIKETFPVSVRPEALNKSFSMVKVCSLSETGVGQRVGSYCKFLLSREDYGINPLLLLATTQEACVGLLRNPQETSTSEPAVPSPCR